MSIIVKYSCGCIGIPIDTEGRCICISACDRDYYTDDPLSFYIREMGGEKYSSSTPLSPEEQETMIRDVGTLMADGYQMRSLATNIGSILNRK